MGDKELPLAFRAQNVGETNISGRRTKFMFIRGVLHVLPKDGKEQEVRFADKHHIAWGLVPNDLKKGETYTWGVVANFLDYYPVAKIGLYQDWWKPEDFPSDNYQVWWTLGDLQSNVLTFSVTNGKLSKRGP